MTPLAYNRTNNCTSPAPSYTGPRGLPRPFSPHQTNLTQTSSPETKCVHLHHPEVQCQVIQPQPLPQPHHLHSRQVSEKVTLMAKIYFYDQIATTRAIQSTSQPTSQGTR